MKCHESRSKHPISGNCNSLTGGRNDIVCSEKHSEKSFDPTCVGNVDTFLSQRFREAQIPTFGRNDSLNFPESISV